jgi:hypothetical protein
MSAPSDRAANQNDIELAAASRLEHGFAFRPHVGAGADVAASMPMLQPRSLA